MKLLGKASLVTGANQGIGRGCCLQLALEGSDVAINYIEGADEAEELADEIHRLGRKAILCPGDVSRRDDVDRIVDQTVAELGGIDILVANASSDIRKSFLELSEEDMSHCLGVCLWGVFHTSQAAARRMVESGRGGSIVVISSVHAIMPLRYSLPYNTAKAAVNHMALTMANELAEHRIRVNIVEPGWTDTPGQRKYYSEDKLREGGRKLPLGRLARIEEIAKGVVFLVSDDASYITGSMLRIDGG
ncbi:MAG TPA: SDR family oxidoreductase, partial [Acidobacteriota bacterium]|nr:SDR family oxidoreductase [Acidobacteriota bacterium]